MLISVYGIAKKEREKMQVADRKRNAHQQMEMSTTHFWRSSQYPKMEVDGHCYFYDSHQHVIIHGKMCLSVYVRILPSYIYCIFIYQSS